MTLDPGGTQSLDPGEGSRGGGPVSHQGFEGFIAEDAVGRLLQLACQVGPQRPQLLPERIARQLGSRGRLHVSDGFYCREIGLRPAGRWHQGLSVLPFGLRVAAASDPAQQVIGKFQDQFGGVLAAQASASRRR